MLPQIVRRADEMPQLAFAPFSFMSAHVASEIDPASIEAWLAQALARKTTFDDLRSGRKLKESSITNRASRRVAVAGAH